MLLMGLGYVRISVVLKMDTNLDVKLFCKYPHIKFIPEKNLYKGYLYTDLKRYNITIEVNKMTGILGLDSTTSNNLKTFENELNSMTKDLVHPLQFLQELEMILSNDEQHLYMNFDTTHDLTILKEYIEFRKFFVNIHKAYVSSDMKLIEIVTIDAAKHVHTLVIEANKDLLNGQKLFSIKEHDLPKFIDSTLCESDDSLICLYAKYKSIIDDENYQNYMNMLHGIDANCWVLEPNDKKLNYRRIALSANASVTITFNSLNIREMPQLKFFGPKEIVSHFERMASTNCFAWDVDGEFLEELSKLLGVEMFPQNKSGEQEGKGDMLLVDEGECAICFMTDLNGKMPEIICPYLNCKRSYHVACLYEWFVSLNPVVDVNEISGKCPNCDKIISCPIWRKNA